MNAAFFSLDRHWRFGYVNAEAERLLSAPGRSCSAARSGSCSRRPSAATSRRTTAARRRPARSGVFEAYYPAPLDAWYEVRAWPSPDGLSVYFLDITERRAAEEQAGQRRSAGVIAGRPPAVTTPGRGGEEAAVQRLACRRPRLGDWVVASLVEEDGRLRDVAAGTATRTCAGGGGALRAAAAGGAAPDRAVPEALRVRPADDRRRRAGRGGRTCRGRSRPLSSGWPRRRRSRAAAWPAGARSAR